VLRHRKGDVYCLHFGAMFSVRARGSIGPIGTGLVRDYCTTRSGLDEGGGGAPDAEEPS